jgi:hypothetical protein
VIDCRDTELALSALRDGALTAPDEVAAVRDHCATCHSCSSFARALRALDGVPAPTAPPTLADRVVATIAAEAEAISLASQQQALASAAVPSADAAGPAAPLQARLAVDAKAPTWLTRQRLWAITGGVAASAAVLVMAVVLSQDLGVRPALDSAARSSLESPAVKEYGAGGSTSAPTAGTSATTAPVSAPDYIVQGGAVFVGGASFDVTSSTLTTLGVVSTSLDLGGSTMELKVFRSTADPRAAILRLPTGSYRRFDPVTRKYGTRTYQLQSGTAITRFGEWPRLVAGIPEPVRKDGYPEMQKFGIDSAGVPVYVRIGANPDAGFAIAPDTTTRDPAAGNPFWTWWTPVPSP